MMPESKLIIAIFLMGMVTFFTRAFPFILPKAFTTNPIIRRVGETLPPAVMVMLIIYALKDTDWSQASSSLVTLIAVAVCGVLQYFFKNMFLSIGAATAFYMAMLQGWLS